MCKLTLALGNGASMTFLVAVAKWLIMVTEGKKNLFYDLRRETVHCGREAVAAGASAGGHIVSTVRKQRKMDNHAQLASSFPSLSHIQDGSSLLS